jgi:hypothetical protein
LYCLTLPHPLESHSNFLTDQTLDALLIHCRETNSQTQGHRQRESRGKRTQQNDTRNHPLDMKALFTADLRGEETPKLKGTNERTNEREKDEQSMTNTRGKEEGN